ncbi:MAG TPA: TSUP family transporter [Herbaspirillum sp.]
MSGDVGLAGVLAMFLVALAGGFLDAIAGGGGLLTLPALLLAGLDPVAAIATNKCQAVAASVSAGVSFSRRGLISWRTLAPAAATAAVASMAGAASVGVLPEGVLDWGVPLLLIAVALYFAFGPRIRTEGGRARLSPAAFALVAAPVLGFYDGVFGPGVGAFYMVALVLLSGCALLQAIAHTKALNAASNLGALAAFAIQGAIVWPVALAMIAGAGLGAQCGAACAMRISPRAIRGLLVCMCCAMALRLLSAPDNPLRYWCMHTLLVPQTAMAHRPTQFHGNTPAFNKLFIYGRGY